jgi:hypothetical protein
VWWPDDADGWARAVHRSGWKEPEAEVEFDGLVVGCDLRGAVVRADVLDPSSAPSRRMFGRRETLGAVATLIAVVVALQLTRNGFRYAMPLAAFWMLGLGYLGLRDERPSVPLSVDDARVAVARHGEIRRLSERRDLSSRLRDAPDRSHRILWELATATGATEADEARAQHVALYETALRAASGVETAPHGPTAGDRPADGRATPDDHGDASG